MPVDYALVPDSRLLVLRYSGSITPDDVIRTVTTFGREHDGFGEIRILSYCTSTADFSDLAPNDIFHIRDSLKRKYREDGIVRRQSAFVIDGSISANILMPLWRAIYEQDPDFGPRIRIFKTLDKACQWLEVDYDAAGRALAGIGS